MKPQRPPNKLQAALAVAIIAMLCIAFGVIAYRSAITKSATFDEPIHFVGGFVALHLGDFRIDAEHPPLFKYWAMLPQPADALKIDPSLPGWDESMRVPWYQWQFIKPTFYRPGGADPDQLLRRSRAMMTLLGVALAALIAWWAWDLAGPWAAVIAAALYCFDPNFLGHAPLVKNDVPITLALSAMIFAVCRIGRRLTLANAIALALVCAAAPLIKLSGTFGIAVAILLLLSRVAWTEPWPVLGKTLVGTGQKLVAAAMLIVFCALVSYAGIWACYRFRYTITPDPNQRLDLSVIARSAVAQRLKNERGTDDEPSAADISAAMLHPPLSIRLINWADDQRILPQAWLSANLSMLTVQTRSVSYLLGRTSATGWWYYFPLAFVFKEPLATLAAITFAGAIATIGVLRRTDSETAAPADAHRGWYIFCIATMLVLYGGVALASPRDVGLRHVFPMFPLIYVLVAAALRRGICWAPRAGVAGVSLLVVALMIDSLRVAPNFIAYFNIAAGGSRGGLRLLGDSNLDWGQDLLLLRDWQQRHPGAKLRLFYFGGADADYYVTTSRFRRRDLTDRADEPDDPAYGPRNVLAISATLLQATFSRGQAAANYAEMRKHKPLEVLGDTIYLYALPLRD